MVEKETKIEVEKHEFVPKHEPVSGDEEKLLTVLGIQKLQLPKILRNDPAIRELKLKYGDIVKITRKSETSGKAVYYRVVV